MIADMARSNPPMASAFVAEFARRLQGQSPALALPLTWIEQRLSERGLTIEQLVQSENQQQAADQVSISNSIGSLRFLGAMDWREFVETMSVVEQTLRDDPGGVYGRMDFATRDRYRHVVEKIAKAQPPVARARWRAQAIQLAHAGRRRGMAATTGAAHVGFYLIDKGLPQLEAQRRRCASPSPRRLARAAAGFRLLLYLGGDRRCITAARRRRLCWRRRMAAELHGWLLAPIGILLLLLHEPARRRARELAGDAAGDAAPAAAHGFLRGHSAGMRARWSSSRRCSPAPQDVDDLVEALEVRFLANRDDHLHFALLTDFRDAPQETLPEDDAAAAAGAGRNRGAEREVPERRARDDPFFLFHRPRRWNPQERVWMGYERKRGKLAELNALLRGGAARPLLAASSATRPSCPSVKYVITLDTDTQLPRDAARQFVGTMAHPLNRRAYDAAQAARVATATASCSRASAVSLPGANRSRFARLFGGEPGIDPYTRAVSDVYQDLFGEGSFIGKGIYDVDAFERALDGRFPENRILSHDLLEGCYARAGAVERRGAVRGLSVPLQRRREPPPPLDSRRLADRRVAAAARARARTRRRIAESALGAVALEDLRQPAAQPASRWRCWCCCCWRWTVLVAALVVWTRCRSSGSSLLPALDAASGQGLLRKPADLPLGQHLRDVARFGARGSSRQACLTLACLPYEAFFSLDAIVRTLVRMLVTRKRLLEWTHVGRLRTRPTRADLAGLLRDDVDRARHRLAAATAYLVLRQPAHSLLAAAAPVALVRLARRSPGGSAGRSSAATPRLTPDADRFSADASRARPGRFFETFVGPEDHWLPPDNYQEHPRAVVAHRTSPTNMGLALLANLAAYDFGYISGRPTARAHGERARDDGDAGAAPRPLLQLVRHAVAAAAAAAVRLDGGQRQPRRPSADAAAGAARARRRHDPRRARVRRLARHAASALADAAAEAARRHRRDRATAARSGVCRTSPPCHARCGATWLARWAASIAERREPAYSTMRLRLSRRATARSGGRRRSTRQCRSALDELTCWPLARAAAGSATAHLLIDAIPTLRELATTIPSSAIRAATASSRRSARGWKLGALAAASAAPASGSRPSNAWPAIGRARRDGVRLPVRRDAPPAGDRLQRRRAPARRELLRSAGLGSAPVPVSSRSPRDNCRRRAGSRWAAC